MSKNLDTIMQADLFKTRIGKQTVSPNAQRVMLCTIAPRDGEPITTWQLKEASGLGERCVRLAVQALEEAGLVFVTNGKPNTYTIQWAEIAKRQRPKAVST